MNKFLVILLASAVIGSTAAASAKQPFASLDFEHYWSLDDINEYLQELVFEFPDLVSIEQYGQTVQGRPIEAFVLRKDGTAKPTIIIESGLRPREWVGVMASMYYIHDIVEHYYEFDDILDNVNLVFVPVANPDGYVYTHTTERSWNKNRRPVSPDCIGADLHRNFQFQFHGATDPCNENYPGPYFFSEAETRAIRDVLINYEADARMYLSVQATGQQILIPYNYYPVPSTNEGRLMALGIQAASAISQAPANRAFAVGAGGMLRGVESGTPVDFAYELRRIMLSYSFRLPSGGPNGWDVPEAQLHDMLSESFRGFLVFARYAAIM